MKKPRYKPIANIPLIFENLAGERIEVDIKIGSPYINEYGVWACPAEMDGIYGRTDVCGEDAFQSLCLAVSYIRMMLTYFIQDGGKIMCASGEEFPIDAYFSNKT